MIQDDVLVESLDAVVKLVDILHNKKKSFSDAEKILLGEFDTDSVKISMNYYVNVVLPKKHGIILFSSDEFLQLGDEINLLIVFLISNQLLSYSKVGEVIERLTILNFAGLVGMNEVKKIFAMMMFGGASNKIQNFLIN